jgi:hypothetical protein
VGMGVAVGGGLGVGAGMNVNVAVGGGVGVGAGVAIGWAVGVAVGVTVAISPWKGVGWSEGCSGVSSKLTLSLIAPCRTSNSLILSRANTARIIATPIPAKVRTVLHRIGEDFRRLLIAARYPPTCLLTNIYLSGFTSPKGQ